MCGEWVFIAGSDHVHEATQSNYLWLQQCDEHCRVCVHACIYSGAGQEEGEYKPTGLTPTKLFTWCSHADH